MTDNYIYTIPFIPPSNNKYQGNGRKGSNFQYQNEKKNWANYCKIYCRPVPPEPLKYCDVTLIYHFKDKLRRDPDNYSGKFILDGLVKAGILIDDSMSVIDTLSITLGECKPKDPAVEIIIKEI